MAAPSEQVSDIGSGTLVPAWQRQSLATAPAAAALAPPDPSPAELTIAPRGNHPYGKASGRGAGGVKGGSVHQKAAELGQKLAQISLENQQLRATADQVVGQLAEQHQNLLVATGQLEAQQQQDLQTLASRQEEVAQKAGMLEAKHDARTELLAAQQLQLRSETFAAAEASGQAVASASQEMQTG